MRNCYLPIDVKNALIEVCKDSFYYKESLFDLFDRAGIPRDIYLKYQDEYKVRIARKVVGELESMGDDGWIIQRRLLSELCHLRDLIDPGADREKGLRALEKLKSLASQHDLIAKQQEQERTWRSAEANARAQREQDFRNQLAELNAAFLELFSMDDRQKRGYLLEKLLTKLFALSGIRYRPPYKIEGEQIDGSFRLEGFEYLVEARWREKPPELADLEAFKGKVDRKLAGTRGVFVSIAGFQPDTIPMLQRTGPANLVLVDGQDLTFILEGRVPLEHGLLAKVEKASQEGILYYPLAGLFM